MEFFGLSYLQMFMAFLSCTQNSASPAVGHTSLEHVWSCLNTIKLAQTWSKSKFSMGIQVGQDSLPLVTLSFESLTPSWERFHSVGFTVFLSAPSVQLSQEGPEPKQQHLLELHLLLPCAFLSHLLSTTNTIINKLRLCSSASVCDWDSECVSFSVFQLLLSANRRKRARSTCPNL